MKTNILKKGDFIKLIGVDNTYGWYKEMDELIGKIGQVTNIHAGEEYMVWFTKQSIEIMWPHGNSKGFSFSASHLKPIISYNKFTEKLDILDKYLLAMHDAIYISHIRDIVNCKKRLDEPLTKVLKTLNYLYTKYKK